MHTLIRFKDGEEIAIPGSSASRLFGKQIDLAMSKDGAISRDEASTHNIARLVNFALRTIMDAESLTP